MPKLGIDKALATDATDYIQAQEDKLNTVDGVVLPDRENAALAKKELEEIQNIMFKVEPPQNEPLLSYERNLLEIEDKLSQLRTPVKDKYIGIIKSIWWILTKSSERYHLSKPPQQEKKRQRKGLLNS